MKTNNHASKLIEQTNIFGGIDKLPILLRPDDLPKAKNDWAFCIQVLLLYKKPVDYFTIVKEFGIVKFQTRIAEILTVYPGLVEVEQGISRKRLGRVVAVHKYFIKDKERAVSLYMSVFNQRKAFYQLFHAKKQCQ